MNNIDQYKTHLEYNGYDIEEEMSYENSCFLKNKSYGPVILSGIGNDGSLGVRFEKYYPIIFSDLAIQNMNELYKMINQMNRELNSGTCYMYDDKGLTMSYSILGNYDKKHAASVLEAFHLDCDKMYSYDLKKYWE